ncbi:MAG: putative DNA binding domain-containing protein, partial [Candidatus Methanoplasma sp.]|nr:putative DNA binding domain-containing protein [Candidatus Methanoplasma sp.]
MESQDEEWKQIWKSECLKHVASMANSSGGVITVGKCDDGNVVGVQNPEKLLKEIPDIVQNKLGFVPVVRPICIDGKTCIEIVVERRDTLVDLDGKFYRRSGSTTHQMVGRELRKALLAEINTSWTDLPIDSVGIDALSPDAVKYFLDAGKKNGMLSESLDGSGVRFVLEHFGMICPDGKITISAALLFLPKPQSAVEGAYAKIGQFSEGGEILREDIIHAPVVMQPDLIMDKLYDKYIPGTYEYEKVQRVTVYRYPHDALREAIVNSLSHKDYWSAEPVTIRVYPNKVTIFNFGELPDDWTVDNLIGEHSSVRRNHKIADVFFEAGYIERWGKGIQK